MSEAISSPENAASAAMSREHIPAWAQLLICCLLAIIGAIATFALYRSSKVADDGQATATKVEVLESQQNGLKSWMEKLDSKTDRILDELRKR